MKELCSSTTLPVYHAPTDSLSSFLSYHSAESTLEMTQPEEDDITTITVGQLNQLFERLNYLENQRAVPLPVPASAPIPAPSTFILPPAPDPEPHIADPTPFSGKRTELQNFLSKCHLKFAGQPSKFKTEQSKIYYLDFHLTDQAYSWFQPLLAAARDDTKPTPPELLSFDALEESLIQAYGDPNLQRSSERALLALEQSSSVSNYTTEFKKIRQYVT